MSKNRNNKKLENTQKPVVNETPVEELQEQEDELDEEVDDIPDEPAEDKDEQEVKPGKFKRFMKGAWKWTKRILPIGAAYGAGYATKAALGKAVGKPADPIATTTPLLTESPKPLEVTPTPAADPVKITEF